MGEGTRKRSGRPVGADSERMHDRIVAAARGVFARDGYESTKNVRIAAIAGIAASSLYHYFPSKLDLFVAVYRDAEARVASRYREAVSSTHGTLERLLAIVDAAEAIYREDPSITLFLARVPTEMRNVPELARAIASCPTTMRPLFRGIVAEGVERGEVRVDADGLVDLFAAITVGVAQFGGAGSVASYARMLDTLRSLARGEAFASRDAPTPERTAIVSAASRAARTRRSPARS